MGVTHEEARRSALGIPGTPSWEDIGTRFVGFWDGFTRLP
jgi:hypothetical protein